MVKKCKARKCPICNSETVEFIREIKMTVPEEFRLPNGYDVVSCVECGFVYADTTATKEDYDYYYENCNWYGEDVKEHEFSNYKICQKYLSENSVLGGELLNIGVGNAHFELELKKAGYKNIQGLDPSLTSIKILKEYGLKGVQGSVYDEVPDDLKGKFDVVFLMCVAEHLYHPDKAILKIKEYLCENGLLIINVPDYSRVNKVITPVADQFNIEHINYFSPMSLKNLCASCGLIKIDGNNFTYYHKEFPSPLTIGVFKKCSVAEEICKDNETALAVKEYLSCQEDDLKEIQEKINLIIQKGKDVIVWGTGAFTMNLLTTTNLGKCNIKCFVDNNSSKIDKMFFDKTIKAPNVLYKNQNADAIIIVCSMLHSNNIIEQITSMGLKNEVLSFT